MIIPKEDRLRSPSSCLLYVGKDRPISHRVDCTFAEIDIYMFTAKRLIRRVPIREMDTVKARQSLVGKKSDLALLERCELLWGNMSDFREQRARAVRFTYGDQWADKIEVNGVVMTQREYLQQSSNMVLQTNQIKNKVDTIVGVMVKEKNEPICNARDRDEQQYGEVMTATLQANCNKNKMESLYIKFMKDLCIGGLALARESYEYKNGRLDSWTEYCEPNCIFFDSEMTDPRFWDINLIGQFFDLPFEQLVARFVKEEKDYSTLKELYHSQSELLRIDSLEDPRERYDDDTLVFRTSQNPARCRVFEVWTKETRPRYRIHDTNEGTEEIIEANDYATLREIDAENKRRLKLAEKAGWSKDEAPTIEKEFFIDEIWYCRFLAPDGSIIWEGESPFADKSHPFTLCATPFVSGKIVGYMNDAIDHNIAMNRAIVLQDWLARTQAKGVTVVPKKIVPNQDMAKFARSWTSMDDMVFIDMKAGEEGLMPKVFYGNAQTYNATELVNMYSKLMENSTAISAAIQGKTPYSGTSGTLYAQMANNSSTPIAALMSQFHTFIEDLHTKKMKNIALFYEPSRFASIVGNIDGIFDNANLNLNRIQDLEYDLSIRESTETPVYRAIINDDAKEFLMNGLITMDEYLMIANVPYADKLMQYRQAREAEVSAASQGEMPQEAINEAAQEQMVQQQVI